MDLLGRADLNCDTLYRMRSFLQIMGHGKIKGEERAPLHRRGGGGVMQWKTRQKRTLRITPWIAEQHGGNWRYRKIRKKSSYLLTIKNQWMGTRGEVGGWMDEIGDGD